jgi:hypothetical protein
MLTNGTPRRRDRGIAQGLPRAGGAEQRGVDCRGGSCVWRSQLPLVGVSVSHDEASWQLSSCRRTFRLVSTSISQIEGPQTPRLSHTPRVAKSRAARVILSREMASSRVIAKMSRFQIDLDEASKRLFQLQPQSRRRKAAARDFSHKAAGDKDQPCLCYFRLILQPILMRRSGTYQVLDIGVMQDDNLVFYQIK